MFLSLFSPSVIGISDGGPLPIARHFGRVHAYPGAPDVPLAVFRHPLTISRRADKMIPENARIDKDWSIPMKQQVITFENPAGLPPQTDRFVAYSRLDLQKKRHQKLLEQAVAMYPEICRGVSLRAVVGTAEEIRLEGEALRLDGVCLTSPAFANLRPDTLKRAYAYFLTIGTCLPRQEAGLVEILIVDTWGTILTDICRELLEQKLAEMNPGLALSPSYGLGFYGVPRSHAQELNRLLDPSVIGIEVMDNDLILPQKSCAGLYLAATDAGGFPTEPTT